MIINQQKQLFHFFISGVAQEVIPDYSLWQLPLSGEINAKPCNSIFTIGDYFLAACKFLSKNNFSILLTGINSVLKKNAGIKNTGIDKIISIKIFLEKHGAFYHPLKIQVTSQANHEWSFVLNGAVSKQGLALIEKEYNLLCDILKKRKCQSHSKHYLPEIYGFGYAKVKQTRVGFFLGEWFEDYKEFHISEDNDIRQITIWESDGSNKYIAMEDGLEIYQEISKILTCYYNLETFEQIAAWHHAAGDFIVNLKNGKTKVKLITVRKYSPLTQLGAGEKNQKTFILPALLFFLLDMTFKMRIDRLNGTGRMVMADNLVINAVIKGFLFSLNEKSQMYEYGNIKKNFIDFFCSFDLGQMLDLMENIVETCYVDSNELQLIEKNFKAHGTLVYSILKNFQGIS